jgi:hypothetical protein
MADSVSLQQNAKYDQNGITVLSNNTSVNERDANGNIIVHTTSSLLIIEAITTNYLTESILPLIDTQFNYFKFPARTAVVDETADLDLDLDLNFTIPDITIPGSTGATATPPLPSEYKPSANQRVPLGSWGNPSVIDFSTVIDGPAQTQPNSLVVTQELIDQLDALATNTATPVIKVTGVIQTRYNSNKNSAIGFSLGLANSVIRYVMTAPAANLKNSGNDIIKATKDDVYTTSIDSTILISEIYVGQELQILGWADESSDNRNHEISANDSFIKFEVGFL